MSYSFDDPAGQDFTSLLLPAQRLRITMAPCRVRFTWFGVEKSLTPKQRARAAERFDAAPQALSAAKKLLDTRHPAFRALTAVRGQIDAYWRSMTLPFPEPSVRLIRLEQVEELNRQMAAYSAELQDAAADLEREFDALKAETARQLGSLFEPSDYPTSLLGYFAVHWDFPNLEPPSNLIWLSPAVHLLEEYRVQTKFEEAVRLADQGFVNEFARLVDHLCERISGAHPDGSPKVFRDGAVNQLGEFIARYRRLNLGSEAQLDEMVALVHRTLEGVAPQRLREHQGLRRRVATQLSWVRAALDAMRDDRPPRQIPRETSHASAGDT
jgi:hypothetical protein